MIRLFNVHYPIRTLILLVGEAVLVWTSFLLGMALQHRDDLYVALNYEGGYLKLLSGDANRADFLSLVRSLRSQSL